MAHSYIQTSPSRLHERHDKRTPHNHNKRGRPPMGERRSSRPNSRSRKVPSSTTVSKLGSHPRSTVVDRADEVLDDTFPHYCMGCDKEFFPIDSDAVLYCSESCQNQDQVSMYPSSFECFASPIDAGISQFPSTKSSRPAGRDIVPQAAPTRFSFSGSLDHVDGYGMPFADSPTSSYGNGADSSFRHSESYTALSSLRSLAGSLPVVDSRSSSTHKPSRSSSGIWNYIPFSSSYSTIFGSPASSPSTTPTESYSSGTTGSRHHAKPAHGNYKRHSMHEIHTQTAAARSREDLVAYSESIGLGWDRPLPPRSGPMGYGKRSRPVDLVTPITEYAS